MTDREAQQAEAIEEAQVKLAAKFNQKKTRPRDAF